MDRLLPFAFAEPAFMKRALLALLLTAPAAAALGVPLVQHRMAFFSDAIGHSAFTGVALGVLLGVSPSWTMVAFGAIVAVAITLVKGRTELSSDTVIGVFFSTVVALGIAIISREKGLTRNLQAFLYGERVAVQERLQVPRQPLLPADDRDSEGDDGREKDADDRSRGEFGASLHQGDGDGDDGAERDHRPGGGDAEENPEGDAGEGGVADRVGEEGHPVLDERDAERGRGGGREE